MTFEVRQGDCVEAMRAMPAGSVDAVVCDPPYGLGFMGKEWDNAAALHLPPSAEALDTPLARMRTGKGPAAVAFDGQAFQAWCQTWATEALRVLKPGGHLLAFGGTRTYHRLACAVEDAGFEIRDSIAWQHQEGVFCACDDPVRRVREGLPDVPAADQAGEGADVQPPVQRREAGPGVGEARAQGSGGPQDVHADVRAGQPGVEGRGDLLAEEGELPADQVREGAGVGATDGPEGRVHHGAPADGGPAGRSAARADGGGAPSGPRPAEQPAGEPGALAVEWIPQGGGAWPGCPRCGKPLAPPFFGGPLTWEYGSGFPKSLDVSKAIDKGAGEQRERLRGVRSGVVGSTFAQDEWSKEYKDSVLSSEPITPEAKEWEGWGTALKPSHEPVVVARKLLSGTVAATVLEHGTGALNVDATRVGNGGQLKWDQPRDMGYHGGTDSEADATSNALGRWPANVVLSHMEECVPVGTRKVKTGTAVRKTGISDAGSFGVGGGGGGLKNRGPEEDATYASPDGTETVTAWRCHPDCPVRLLDEQTGETRSPSTYERAEGSRDGMPHPMDWGNQTDEPIAVNYGDSGGGSRFFKTTDYYHEEVERERLSNRDSGDGDGSAQDDDGVESGDGPSRDGGGHRTARDSPRPGEADPESTRIPHGGHSDRGSDLFGMEEATDNLRFRYVAKASRGERNAGLEGFEEKANPKFDGGDFIRGGDNNAKDQVARNVHPTVKPIALMRWLVRLVTPPNGVVLDPFCGSGSTGCAAVLEGFDFIGLEREAEYVAIANARIAWWHKHRGDGEAAEILAAGELRESVEATGQLGMFDDDEPAVVDRAGREGEASADRTYTDRGGSNFAMKPGRRR